MAQDSIAHFALTDTTAYATRVAAAAKVRYLSENEAQRLVNACREDLRALTFAALLTGARYGELAAVTVGDFDPTSGTLHIPRSKGGRPRYIPLTDEARTFFACAAVNKDHKALLFTRKSGEAWGRSQFRTPNEACDAAKIKPSRPIRR